MTDFLFSTPSVLEGIGRIFDFSGSMQVYNESRTPEEADSLAICNDFKSIGIDIKSAVIQYQKEIQAM